MTEAVFSNEASSEGSLSQAQTALQHGDPASAATFAGRALEAAPEHGDALYVLAVAQRYLERPDDARAALERLQAVRPAYGRAYQELGHLSRQAGDAAGARAAYEQAVALNPGLPASWQALTTLYWTQGATEPAERARAQAERLAALPRALVSVTSFMHEGKLYKAERLCRSFLQHNGHHVEGMRLLANLGMRLNVLDDAEFLLASALELDPDFPLARIDYVNVLQRRQKYRQALEQARLVRAADPANPPIEAMYANACMAVGDHETAIEIYDAVIEQAPDHAALHLARGHALKTIGSQEAAIGAYRAAHGVKPDFGDAFWSLANLKTYRFPDHEVEQMAARERAPGVALEDRFHLCFALGKALEDRAEVGRAFTYYERGNALKQAQVDYSSERMEAEFERQKAVCTRALFERRQGVGHPGPDPIFIVGLPRSGSTLLEQILASHSQVDGTLELPNVLAIAHRLGGRRKMNETPRYPANLNTLDAARFRQLGEQYLRDTALHREQAPRFTDKMPNNFRHLGLIHLMLPNATVIDARRHPMACCFSGFKQLFAEGQAFTYGLEQMGRYYRAYVDLMDHWDTVLPGRILRVHYEDVVGDLESEVGRLLDFCGLPFEQACLDFHQTERSVRTASSEQVRQPLYEAGLEPWRPFEPYLGPLKRALGSVLERYPIAASA